jgi:hypothetical protein
MHSTNDVVVVHSQRIPGFLTTLEILHDQVIKVDDTVPGLLEKLSAGKPNFLIDTVADLPKVLKKIDVLRLKSHYGSEE